MASRCVCGAPRRDRAAAGVRGPWRLAAIVENSEDAIIGETLEGIITSLNPAAARMFGSFKDEVMGEPVGLLIPQDRAEEATAVLAKVSAGWHVEQLDALNVRRRDKCDHDRQAPCRGRDQGDRGCDLSRGSGRIVCECQPLAPWARFSAAWWVWRAFSSSWDIGLRSKTTFFTVPVKAYGALSA